MPPIPASCQKGPNNITRGGRLTGDTGDGFLARQIGDVDEGVVERGEDVSNTKDKLAISDLRAERDGSGFLRGFRNFGRLWTSG